MATNEYANRDIGMYEEIQSDSLRDASLEKKSDSYLVEYKKKVENKYARVRVFNIDDNRERSYVPVSEMFVDLECVPYIKPGMRYSENEYFRSKKSCDELICSADYDDEQNRQDEMNMCILGLPGAGKTTLLKYMLHRYNKYAFIIPIYIELKGDDDFKQIILQNYNSVGLDIIDQFKRKYYERVLGSTRKVDSFLASLNEEDVEYIFFCDGLDEISREDYAKFTQAIKRMKEFDRHRCVISSRDIGFYAKDFKSFNLICLLDFTIDKSKKFVQKYFRLIKEKFSSGDSLDLVEREKNICRLIDNNPTISKLSQSPILLSLLCVTKNLNEIKNKADLFKNSIKLLLKNREITDEEEQERFIDFLKEIAVVFYKLDQEECFEATELDFYADKYFKTHGEIKNRANYLQCGLFEQSSKEAFYKFSHRTIWEYLVALGLVGTDRNLIYCRANMETWEEPIKMYVTLIEKKEQDEFFEQLWKRNKSLTLRCMAELDEFPSKMFNSLYGDLKQKEKLSLVAALRESYEKPITDYRKQIVNTIVDTLKLVHQAEAINKDCEVIYSYLSLLDEYKDEEPVFGKTLDLFLDLDNAFLRREMMKEKFGLKLVPIRAGHFKMGRDYSGEQFFTENGQDDTVKTDSEETPQHKVLLTDDYHMSATLITNAMFYSSGFPYADESRLNNNPYSNKPSQPVNKVSWYEAAVFAKWLGCTLPTEAEWEFALVGNAVDRDLLLKDRLSDIDAILQKLACYSDNSQNQTRDVIPIDYSKTTSNGLLDMLGNLREWCLDWYDEDYYRKCSVDSYPNFAEDIEGKEVVTYDDEGNMVEDQSMSDLECFTFNKDGYCVNPCRKTPKRYETKCLRGGCFDWNKTNLRPTYRNHNPANNVYKVNGFRLVFK